MSKSIPFKQFLLVSLLLVTISAIGFLTFFLTQPTHAASVQSVKSGNWSDATVWSTNTVPTTGDTITISPGHTVTYNIQSDTVLGAVNIEGTLKFSRTANTRLKTSDNIVVKSGGFLDMGIPQDFIPRNVKAEVIFVFPSTKIFVGGNAFVPGDTGLWVMHGGRWETHGTPIVRAWSKLAQDASVQTTTIITDQNVSDWYVGSTVVVTQTSNPLPTHPESVVLENELRTLVAIEPLADGKTRLTLDRPLSFFHQGTGQERGEVGLLTRNILITTDIVGVDEKTLESWSQTSRNGRKFAHTMFMGGAKGNIQYTEFKYMGHFRALGRYPVHFHVMGDSSRGMKATGNSVWYGGNRAYVVHESSGVLVQDNVAFNTVSSPYFIEMTTNPSTDCQIQLATVMFAPQDNVLS